MSERRGGWLRRGTLGVLLALWAAACFARGDALPPRPDHYVTDQAGVLDSAVAAQLDSQLEQYERTTSNQILVAIYPSLPPDQDVAQYSAEIGDAWQVGQKGKDNGAILFVFINDHKVFIATGRGLEGALPDATCKNIITEVITPRFKKGDYTGGVQQGVQAMLSAAQGEYKGNGTTVADQRDSSGQGQGIWPFIVLLIILFVAFRASRGGGIAGPLIFTSGGWSGGGGGGWGGGGGGGGGGGFSGGGGSFGGGGAGGSW
jgi:uncharacterized protein